MLRRSSPVPSTICFGSDGPPMPKRATGSARAPAEQEPVASPATTARIRDSMRHKMLEGNDEAFRWEGGSPEVKRNHAPLLPNPDFKVKDCAENRRANTASHFTIGGDEAETPAEAKRNHAPLLPNPEIHVKDFDENRRANTTSHFTIGEEQEEETQLGGKIPSQIPERRAHGTTKEEAAQLASRLAVASPHTMKQRSLGEHAESSPAVTARSIKPNLASSLVLGTSESPMQTARTRAQVSTRPLADDLSRWVRGPLLLLLLLLDLHLHLAFSPCRSGAGVLCGCQRCDGAVSGGAVHCCGEQQGTLSALHAGVLLTSRLRLRVCP